MAEFDPWFLDNLVCPVEKIPLKHENGRLRSEAGREYFVVDGVPVMLRSDIEATLHVATSSIARASGNEAIVDKRAPDLYLETLGMGDVEKQLVAKIYHESTYSVDPVVQGMIEATSGMAYRNLVGENILQAYPIPNISLPPGNGQYLLDIGCNWGRWSMAAARKGYVPVGVDPSLGAIMAARRVARQLGLPNRYVVADARELPFKDGVFDVTYSYSVLQHLAKSDARAALCEVRRVLKSSGMSRIQMAHRIGIRSLQHQLRRGFREPVGFEVRYWSLGELRDTFNRLVGPTTIHVDCFFGLGFQLADYAFMRRRHRPILLASEALRRMSKVLPFLAHVADSVFCQSRKREEAGSLVADRRV